MMKAAISRLVRRMSTPPKRVAAGGDGSATRATEAWRSLKPVYTEMTETARGLVHTPVAGMANWYPSVMIGAAALGSQILRPETVAEANCLLASLTPDDYSIFLQNFYADGLRRFGKDWGYGDIVTVLLVLSRHVQPRNYLEIGVRRGRSVCAVASRAQTCDLVMFDMWVQDYAGMDNPGPSFVVAELDRIGHIGRRNFVDGNSHETLPAYFAAHPDECFDLITVDGDHSPDGAARDLADVLPRLTLGGAIVFDDVCHPLHPELNRVWREMVIEDPRFSSWSCDDVGYGVAFAIRRW
jgi:predicted O-methyltransferase YrrM